MDRTLETWRSFIEKVLGQNNKDVEETRRLSTKGLSDIKQTNAVKERLLAETKRSLTVWVELRFENSWTF